MYFSVFLSLSLFVSCSELGQNGIFRLLFIVGDTAEFTQNADKPQKLHRLQMISIRRILKRVWTSEHHRTVRCLVHIQKNKTKVIEQNVCYHTWGLIKSALIHTHTASQTEHSIGVHTQCFSVMSKMFRNLFNAFVRQTSKLNDVVFTTTSHNQLRPLSASACCFLCSLKGSVRNPSAAIRSTHRRSAMSTAKH